MSDVYWDMNWNDLTEQETIHLPKETDSVFVEKLSSLLDKLPEKTVVVSHGTCVMTLIELALGAKVEKVPEWDGSIKNASVSKVSHGTLEYLSKTVC
jgi:broad specificity phosphatase PhoE